MVSKYKKYIDDILLNMTIALAGAAPVKHEVKDVKSTHIEGRVEQLENAVIGLGEHLDTRLNELAVELKTNHEDLMHNRDT